MARSIPSPRTFPIVGTLPYYHFFRDGYSFDQLHLTGLKKYRQFGPVVREEIVPGNNMYWLFHPDDIKTMYEVEGEYPSRRSHLALAHYRLSKPHLYSNAGLLPTNGPEWLRIRQAFQFRPKVVTELLPAISEAANDFVLMIKKKNCREIEILSELKKFFLEVTVLFLFGIRLEALQPENPVADRLISAALETNENILRTDNSLHLWKFVKTRGYSSIARGQECIEREAMNLMSNNNVRFPFKEENVDERDIFGFIADMLLAGIDTSAYSTSFLFYHLARDQVRQDLLRQNCDRSRSSLQTFAYGKAALKESLRLNPISVGVSRFSTQEATFSGYLIPEGSLLISQNQISCRLPEFIDHPNTFKPERWGRSLGCTKDQGYTQKEVHPYLSLPFGHGKRMCIGRRLAEHSILTLTNHFFGNFQASWKNQGELGIITNLINKPDRPIILNLKEI